MIEKASIYNFEIPVPSLEMQNDAVARIEKLEASKTFLRAEIKDTEEMMKLFLEQSYTSTARLSEEINPIVGQSDNSMVSVDNKLSEPAKTNPPAELVSSSEDESSSSEEESETDEE